MSGKYLIVGLGNPGRQYAKTRHNAGFWVVDELVHRHQLSAFRSERKALVTDGILKGKRVLLAKPQTYMNLSGEAVRALVDFYKIEQQHILVIHDDLDTPLGTMRLRKTGGHGGQNGLRNIILHLGSKEFARLRFGIGRPPGKMRPKDYVLQKLTGDEMPLVEPVLERAVAAVEYWLEHGIEQTMSQFNGGVDEQPKSKEDDPQQQLEIAQRAHELNPNDPRPLEQMARLYKRLRKLDEAARTHLLLAELHRKQEQPRQMLAQWEQAVRIRPRLIDVREELALGYEEQDNKKKAVQTWLALSEFQEKEGALDDALASVGEALRINPQHPKAVERQLALRKRLTM